MRVIDAAELASANPGIRSRAIGDMVRTCRSAGYFSLQNTCINPGTLERVFSQAGALFALPDDDPRKLAVRAEDFPGGVGWTGLFKEPAYTPGTVAHMEAFDCGPYRRDITQLENPAALGLYPSCWPDLPGFRGAVRACWDELRELGSVLYAAFASGLGLEEGFFDNRCTAIAPNTMRLISYPDNDGPDDGTHVGISEHTDFECFTVVYQTAPGLELLGRSGNWSCAPVADGQFTVMIGDMLEIWTNGYLGATRHRVGNTPWARHSLVMFFAADSDCRAEPLGQFTDDDNPPRYAAVTQQQQISRAMEKAEANRLAMSQD